MTTPIEPHLNRRTDPDRIADPASGPELGCSATAFVSPPSSGQVSGPEPAAACSGPPGGTWQPPALCIEAPGEFIAAVPAVLGFVPRRSLVACLLRPLAGHDDSLVLDAVARHDLALPDGGSRSRLATRLAGICLEEGAAVVLLLVVDDRLAARSPARRVTLRRRHQELLSVIGQELETAQVAIADVWAVREIAAGAPWWGVAQPNRAGRQADPCGSPVALASVLEGRPIHGKRADLERVVRVDPDFAAAVGARIPPAVREQDQAYRRAVRHRDVTGYQREALLGVLAAVDRFAATDRLAPATVADIAVALRDKTVRDAMFALAGTPRARAAELLWERMVRGLRGSDRAEVAALYGYSAYARGDGTLAGVALAASLEADSRHTMAGLLHDALQAGMRPDALRTLVRSGRACAAELGVELTADGGAP